MAIKSEKLVEETKKTLIIAKRSLIKRLKVRLTRENKDE